MADMSEKDQEQTPPGNDLQEEEGFLHLEANTDRPDDKQTDQPLIAPDKAATLSSSQAYERIGTAEHLAAQRSFSPLDAEAPEVKQQLNKLRTEITRLLTSLRWEGASIEETARKLLPLLNVGPIVQWQSVLIPFLYEIDRAGALIPTWLSIIDNYAPDDQAPETNLSETEEGRARRYAILMLGNYRTMGISGTPGRQGEIAANLPQYLGHLATDANVSMYATEALVKQATVPAMQALIEALPNAKGWAKVDVIEGCLAFKQERYYDMVVSSGLEDARGLESYIAIPVYRTVPLEYYFSADQKVTPRLQANAALIFQRVLRDSLNPPVDNGTQPPAFARHFPTVAQALFSAARREPTWQYAAAVHYLGLLMGRYWSEIAKNTIKDGAIIEQIYEFSTQMNDVERWMAGPGRDTLLQALSNPQETNLALVARILGETRDPRAVGPLLEQLERTKIPRDRGHALTLGAFCEALGSIGDRRAAIPMSQLVNRTVDRARRGHQPKRRDNLPFGDADVPGSIIYAAALRACGQLGERGVIEFLWSGSEDLDPYVRTQALEALQHLDPQGEYPRSREVAREALNDPRESVVQQATRLVTQYRDTDAEPILRRGLENRPELNGLFQETLRTLGS